jgi:hypothetical protein
MCKYYLMISNTLVTAIWTSLTVSPALSAECDSHTGNWYPAEMKQEKNEQL